MSAMEGPQQRERRSRRSTDESARPVDPGPESAASPAIPPFNPAAWVSQATRTVDVSASAATLLAVLADQNLGDLPVGLEAENRDLVQRLAAALRTQTPLYALTAALVAPYLTAALAPGEATPQQALQANLHHLLEHQYTAPARGTFDPWAGLAEWLWSHEAAWAVADMADQLGAARVRELAPEEYRRLRATYIARIEPGILHARLSHLLLTYAQEFAKVVVELLNLPAANAEQRDSLLGRRAWGAITEILSPAQPSATRQRPAFLEDNHLRVMNADHYHALREALYLNTFAHVEGQPWPTADLRPAGVQGQAILRPPAADSGMAVPIEQVEHWARAMWRQQKELSDLDADALDALCAIWLYQARTAGDRAVADIDGLLAMRGIQPRQREYGGRKRIGYEKEQREEMMRAVAHIQNLWINVGEAATQDDRSRAPTRVVQSRAFVVTDRVGQIDPNGEMVDIERFVFRPGEVFAHYLMGPGSQTALLSARALKYDPYRQVSEKRLARFLSWQWRTSGTSDHQTRLYRVQTLLDAVGKSTDIRYPHRTRDRLEKALDTLKDDAVIAAWHYTGWDEDVVTKRGWLGHWLASTVLIEPPRVVQESRTPSTLAPVRPGQPGIGHSIPVAELMARVRERRQELKLSQALAAAALGVTQSYFSKLERGAAGDKQISADLKQRLIAWLQEH
jgi:DNA-binding XRE family transcriptional regulator